MSGLVKDYDTFRIPYSLTETEQLERFFEKKAGEGHMIKSLSSFGQRGDFLMTAPGKYHFSIGIYGKKVTKEEEKTEQFMEFRQRWEESGWIYDAALKNLVVFYSSKEERPTVPYTVYPPCRPEGAREVTVKEENKALLSMSVINLLLAIPYLFLFAINPIRRNHHYELLELLSCLCIVLTLFWIWVTPAIAMKLRQREAVRYRKETGSVPEFYLFWDELTLNTAGSLALSIVGIIFGLKSLAFRTTALSAAAFLVTAVYTIFLYQEYRKKRDRYYGVKRFISVTAFLLLIAAFCFYPYQETYRYAPSGADWLMGSKAEEREVISQGLSPEELGWGEEEYNFYMDTSNMACRSERIIFHRQETEYAMDIRRDDYEKNSRYIGTVQAELRKETYRNLYLKQKKLSLDGSILLDTKGEMNYYLTQTGKEIIGVSGKKVVIYFLNTYDERSFNPQDGKLLKELEKLEQKQKSGESGSVRAAAQS